MSATRGDIPPVFTVIGPDRFLRNEALQSIVDQLADELDSLTRVDGAEAVLAEVLDEARTMSLLGARRVVAIDEADPFISRHRAALERYCAEPSPSGCLVLACNSLPRNTRLYKIINTRGKIVHCPPPRGRAVIDWMITRANITYGKSLSSAAAQSLRDHLGNAPGVLDAELAKLTAYVGNRPEITPTDVDALTGHHREEKVFAVTDAMSSGDTQSALGHWEQVLATDLAAPGRAIAGLAWGIRRLLEARRDWENGTDLGSIAARMYTEPARLRRRLEHVTSKQLQRQLKDLLAADVAVKTGASTIDAAVERFIVKHSTSARRMAPAGGRTV